MENLLQFGELTKRKKNNLVASKENPMTSTYLDYPPKEMQRILDKLTDEK